MLKHDSTCACCRVINRICYRESQPQARWQRYVLLLCAFPFVLGIPVLLWIIGVQPNTFVLWLLGGAVFLLALLWLIVGCRGCNACVAQLFGAL
jgi:hypothetical protein